MKLLSHFLVPIILPKRIKTALKAVYMLLSVAAAKYELPKFAGFTSTEDKFRFGVKKVTLPPFLLSFLILLLFSPLFFLFSELLLGFTSVGKVSAKMPRVVKFFERK